MKIQGGENEKKNPKIRKSEIFNSFAFSDLFFFHSDPLIQSLIISELFISLCDCCCFSDSIGNNFSPYAKDLSVLKMQEKISVNRPSKSC